MLLGQTWQLFLHDMCMKPGFCHDRIRSKGGCGWLVLAACVAGHAGAHFAAFAHISPRLALGVVVGAVVGRAYSAAREQQREQPACGVAHVYDWPLNCGECGVL